MLATRVSFSLRSASSKRFTDDRARISRVAFARALERSPKGSAARPYARGSASPTPRATSDDERARASDDDEPIWARRDEARKAAKEAGGVPWPLYLLGSVIVLIAATGSAFEYAYKNPIFGVVSADSALYAPILGWFVITGFPLAGWFWKKGIDGANEASEAQDKIDGY